MTTYRKSACCNDSLISKIISIGILMKMQA